MLILIFFLKFIKYKINNDGPKNHAQYIKVLEKPSNVTKNPLIVFPTIIPEFERLARIENWSAPIFGLVVSIRSARLIVENPPYKNLYKQ